MMHRADAHNRVDVLLLVDGYAELRILQNGGKTETVHSTIDATPVPTNGLVNQQTTRYT
jgi:hypothetical protein